MARSARLWQPGDILSVVGRGHEGRPLFASDDDRRFFVSRLRRVFRPPAVTLLAWSLPINHYHLMLQLEDAAPDELFRSFNTALALRERRRCGEHGAVFQGRYWSRACTSEADLWNVLTYVLGNPAHHGIVASAEGLETCPLTAYGEVLGVAPQLAVYAARTLGLLHADPATARRMLREAMDVRVARWQAERAGVDACDEPGCRGEQDGCRLLHPPARRRAAGDVSPHPTPLAWHTRGISRVHDERSDRRARLRSEGWRPSDLVERICARLAADASALRSGGRGDAECRARAVIAYVACDGVGVTAEDVAEIVGVGGPSVSRARRRGRALLQQLGAGVDEVLSWTAPGAGPAAGDDPAFCLLGGRRAP